MRSIVCAIIACAVNVSALWAGAPWGEVLPEGRSWILLYSVSMWGSEKYDNSGNKAPIIAGAETEGRELHYLAEYAYGLSEALTVGMIIPYGTRSLEVKPTVIPKQERTGAGDIKLGGQYRYRKSENCVLTFRSAAKLPTGRVDDPDDPRDIELGTGQAYVEFTNFSDHYFAQKQWVASTMVRVNIQLPAEYKTTRSRVATSGSDYTKDPGDELWLAAGLERKNAFVQGLSASMRAEVRYDDEDNYSSLSSSYDQLRETGTKGELFFVQPEIKYSAYKTHKIPARLYANYRIPVIGKNNYVANRLEIGCDIFF
ncbi:MAG: hypothetical protein A2293_13940 [Elusimicrobia bacterium RIFOXYB2_FULL_49_7]|nr:MAG: hypothetical protein A2293_13940 [Elusimicrobia bacterium RIFOXYB2_FULL_49_7]